MRTLLGCKDTLVAMLLFCPDEDLDSIFRCSWELLAGVLWTVLVHGRAPAHAQHLVLDMQCLQALMMGFDRPYAVCFLPR